MAGIAGPYADAAAKRIVAEDAGAVVLLRRNVENAEQIRALTDGLRASAPAGLLVAVDEEGGRVARLAAAGIAPRLPAARDLAEQATPEEVRALGADLGRHLRAVGVDWNLAPVLDVTIAPDRTVIGDRSYSGDPGVVAAYGSAFAQGLRDGGALTAAKHFPGHGRSDVDSHVRPSTVAAGLDELRASDLVPYGGVTTDAVMTSHLDYPALDPQRPASLSPAVAALLRQEIGFDGVLMTDALEMGAITTRWDVATAAEMAIAAGADLALVGEPGNAAPTTDRIAAAVAAGRVPQVRLQEAVRRVLTLKGIGTATASCLLGLPPIAHAAAAVDGAGQVWAIADGVRHTVPDRETEAALGLQPARYADEEVNSLPVGQPIPTVRRFAAETVVAPGADPVPAAVHLSRVRFPAAEAEQVVLARADDYADALGGAGLAGMDAPLLLLRRGGDEVQQRLVADEVARVLAADGALYVLGGDAALSASDLGALAADPRVVRLAGADRYATAARVAAEVVAQGRSEDATAILVRGDDWADAIAAAPLSAASGWPVLLTRPDALPEVTRQALRGIDRTLVLGGTHAVAESVAAAAPHPQRLSGATRAATAVAVAGDAWGRHQGTPGDAFLFVADDWAAALAAAGLAADARAPLLLTGATLPPEVGAWLTELHYPEGATARALLAGTAVPGGLYDIR